MRFGYLSYAPSFRVPVGAFIMASSHFQTLLGVVRVAVGGFSPGCGPSLLAHLSCIHTST